MSETTESTELNATCDEVHDRLLGLRGPLDDTSSRHARSCLRCFRTAADLRDLPRIEALLRADEQRAAPDPGEAFWAAFPGRIADAWQAGLAVQAQAARPTRVSWRQRLAGFVKMPLPAAFAGAAAALVLAHASARLPLSRPRDHGAAAVAALPARAGAGGAAVMGTPRGLEVGFADGLAELEVNALETLVHDMQLETEVPAPAATDDAAALRPLPADELELLDDDALETFVGGLGRTI